MKKNLLRFGAMSALLVTSLSATAIDPPQLPTSSLSSGEKYILFNKARPDGFWSRTSWDGAFYYLGENESNYANHQLEAVKNEDGTWSFTQTTAATEEGAEPTVSYFTIPEGTANLNMKETYTTWNVEVSDKYTGYYKMSPVEGSNINTLGKYMHLNSGYQYVVISFLGDGWYPDFPVKTTQDVDGNNLYAYMDNGVEAWWNGEAKDCDNLVWSDSTSLYWAFVKAEAVEEFAALNGAYNAIVNCTENYATI